jgi:glycosyltransferase involved in cell wall biosynthesis
MITTVRDTVRGYFWLGRTIARTLGRRVGASQRHLLLLAWAFPPRTGGGVYRPAALARYASRRGWRVTVLSARAPEVVGTAGRHILDYVGSAARILPVTTPTLRPSHRGFPNVDGGFLNALQMTDLAFRELGSDPPGVIVASGPPFHSFVAARYLGRAFGVPYVLDYRDEWTECPFTFVDKGNADLYYERVCLRAATRVVFTTESQLDHQVARFVQAQRSRCLVIPNGWEAADLAAPSDAQSPLPRVGTRIAFVGTLSDYAMPEMFLATMAAILERQPSLISALRLTFVGRRGAAADRALRGFRFQSVLEVIDEVPRPQAMTIMRQADALLLINESALERYRPGKVYDYLAMETPILVYGSGGEVAKLVRELDAGYVARPGDVEDLGKALVVLRGLRDRAVERGIREWLVEHTRERLAGRMVDVLEDILSSPRPRDSSPEMHQGVRSSPQES